MKQTFFFIVCAILISCASSKQTTVSNINTVTDTSTRKSGDGFSIENAIVINERTESSGVAKEYLWLRENYPGYKFVMQSSRKEKGRQYDILTIKTADGIQKAIYFDISNFYGRL
ncbi:MAG TPA: hypothetical protein VGP43_11785 [Chitinophagaceae bacterium]|nr:hypothetical protein [Chitinophagaceae bacterium]